MTFKVDTNTSSSNNDESGGARRRLQQASSSLPGDAASPAEALKHHSGKRTSDMTDSQPRRNSKVSLDGISPSDGQAVIAFLGMPEDSKWLLYADGEIDRTVGMRDVLTYAAGNRMGRWAPRTQWCEVFVVQVRCYAKQGTRYVNTLICDIMLCDWPHWQLRPV